MKPERIRWILREKICSRISLRFCIFVTKPDDVFVSILTTTHQICNLIGVPSKLMIFCLKSIPADRFIVYIYYSDWANVG